MEAFGPLSPVFPGFGIEYKATIIINMFIPPSTTLSNCLPPDPSFSCSLVTHWQKISLWSTGYHTSHDKFSKSPSTSQNSRLWSRLCFICPSRHASVFRNPLRLSGMLSLGRCLQYHNLLLSRRRPVREWPWGIYAARLIPLFRLLERAFRPYLQPQCHYECRRLYVSEFPLRSASCASNRPRLCGFGSP